MTQRLYENLDAGNAVKILNLPDPTNAQDAATKHYVDILRSPVRGSITGDGTTTAFTITHNLGLTSPYTLVPLFFASSGTDLIEQPAISALGANTFVATFTPAPANGAVINWLVSTGGTGPAGPQGPATSGITLLGPSTGTDDLAAINSALAGGGYVRGLVGTTYLLSAPPAVGSDTTLDMTGCHITYANTSVRNNLLNNAAVAPSATATDVATTVGSSVITSAALVAAGAAVGMSVGVVGAGVSVTTSVSTARIWFYGKITAISGNNITLGGNYVGTQADVTVSGATGYLFKTRDSNITIIGGTWDAGTNWNLQADRYNYAYLSNMLRFRRCDGLTVRDVKLTIDYGYASSGLGWCFGINPADCSNILIDNIRNPAGQAAPTFVNSSGLIQECVVTNIFGTSYDDMVAFGCVGAGGDDIEGDIGSLVIDGVFSPATGGPPAWNKGSNRGVDLYTGKGSNGQQRVFWQFDVRSVKGTYNNWPVSLVSYPAITGQAANFIGNLRDITGFCSGKPTVFIGRADGTNAGLGTGLDVGGTINGSIGNGYGGVQITANQTYTTATSDIAGLSMSFTAPPNGNVWLEFFCYALQQAATTGGNMLIYITDNSNNVVHQAFAGNIAAGGVSPSVSLKVLVTQLVSGTSYTYKVRGSSAGTGTPSVLAGTTYPAWFRASPQVQGA